MGYNWIVSFSNGKQLAMRSLVNGDGINPWDKVLNYYRSNPDIDMTHLEIVVNGRHYNSPVNSYSTRFPSGDSIKYFWVFYKEVTDVDSSDESETYIGYSYTSGDCRHIFRVNDKRTAS